MKIFKIPKQIFPCCVFLKSAGFKVNDTDNRLITACDRTTKVKYLLIQRQIEKTLTLEKGFFSIFFLHFFMFLFIL